MPLPGWLASMATRQTKQATAVTRAAPGQSTVVHRTATAPSASNRPVTPGKAIHRAGARHNRRYT